MSASALRDRVVRVRHFGLVLRVCELQVVVLRDVLLLPGEEPPEAVEQHADATEARIEGPRKAAVRAGTLAFSG